MNVAREVILDLLPVYLAGEASPATCALIDEYLKQDLQLAQYVRDSSVQRLANLTQRQLSPDIELRSLHRARALIGWQKWLFGLGIAFTALSLTSEISFDGGRFREFHLLIRDYPAQFGSFAVLALICWIIYYAIRRRLRIDKPH